MSSPKSASRSVYIDNTSAELALNKLITKMKSLEAEIAKGTLSGDRLNKKIKELDNTKQSIQSLQDQISKGLRPTFVQVENQVRQLRNELKRMSEDAPGYAQKFEAFKNATAELNRMQTAISGVDKAQRSWMQEAKTVAFGVLIGNTVQSALQAITGYLGGIVSGNAKLSDSLADVEKATGLTSAEVKDLNSQLGKIDTRTATSDLREIATGLGQIGEAATAANVEGIDKIVVALGDEFGGGAREITTTLSVLRNNLQDIKSGDYGDDVLKIGNALNTLGAEGLATAPVVTDIANRVAGVAQTFGVSSGEILGLAATFQELGIETERGSTAVIKLFQKIGAEPEKFAKITKLSAKEFTDLVNRDMLGAFQLVAQGAKEAGSNNVVFSQILKELDADGSGAGEVLSKLGSNAELLAKKINTATGALQSNDSILEEFNKKNNTLGAELDKLNKSFEGLIQSQTLSELFAGAVRSLNVFIDALKAAPKWIEENETGLYLLIAGIALFNASLIKSGALVIKDTAIKLYNATVTKATAIASNIATAAQAAYIVVTNLLTGAITLATAAQRVWNIAMSLGAGPIGVIVALIGAAVIAIKSYIGSTKTLTAEQQRANHELEKSKQITESWAQIQEAANKSVAETVTKLKELAKAAEDTSKSDQERKKAIEEIIAINPKFFAGLDLEATKTGLLKTKIDEYTEALKAAALEKAMFDKRVALEQQKLDLQSKLDPGKLIGKDGKEVNLGSTTDAKDAVQIKSVGEKILDKQKQEIQGQIDVVDAQLRFLDTKTEELKNKAKAVNTSGTATNPFGDDDKKAQDKINKLREEYLKLRADITDTINQLSKSSFAYSFDKIFQEKLEQEKKIKEFFKKGVITGKERDEALRDIQRETEAKVTKLINELNSKLKEQPVTVDVMPEVKEEDIDVVRAALRNAFDQLDKDERDRVAARSLVLLNGTSKQKLDATLEILKEERDAELNNANLTANEKLLIEAKYQDKVKEARQKFLTDEAEAIATVLGYAAKAIDILSQFEQARSAKENAALNRELKANDAKKAAYQRQLDGKLISQKQYESRVAALDREAQTKRDALEKQQNERKRKFSIAQAIINGALGVTQAFASLPTPAAIIASIFVAATTAAQIATISAQKFAKGGIARGAKHSEGGIKMVDSKTGNVVGEMENNEPYMILSDNTYRNNKPIVDALLHSSMHQNGRQINPWWQSRSYQAVNYPVIQTTFTKQRMYANGGMFNAAPSTTQQQSGNDEEMKMLMRALLYRAENPVTPVIDKVDVAVPLTKINEAEARKQQIENDSALK